MRERERLIELIKDGSTKAGEHLREVTKKVLAEKGSFNSRADCDRRNIYEIEADYLLENGVLVPPCKVGDVVYARKGCFYLPHATGIKPETIIACEIIAIKETKKGKFLLLKPLIEEVFNMRSANDWFSFLAIGKTVFFSEKEAEQALYKIPHDSLCETETYKVGE